MKGLAKLFSMKPLMRIPGMVKINMEMQMIQVYGSMSKEEFVSNDRTVHSVNELKMPKISIVAIN